MASFETRDVKVKERKKGSVPGLFIFVVFFIVGVLGLIFFFNYLEDTRYGTESTAIVMQKVTNAVEDGYVNIVDNINNEDMSAISKNNSINNQIVGFNEMSVIDFVKNSSTVLQLLNATEYLVRNINILNGYESSFDIDTEYFGSAEFMGRQDSVVMKVSQDTDGFYITYDTVSGYRINMCVNYSYKTKKLNELSVTCSKNPTASLMFSYYMNFVNYDYYALEFYNIDNSFSNKVASEIIFKFNTNKLTFEEMMSYDFTNLNVLKGNFKDNSKFVGYSYDVLRSTPIEESLIKPFYDNVYKKVNDLKMFSSSDTLSNQANDVECDLMGIAFKYAENRSTLTTFISNSKTYYAYLFLDYGELVTVIKNVKNELNNLNSTFDENEIALVQSVSAYLSATGRKSYVGTLGEHNGEMLTLTAEPKLSTENNRVKILTKYILSNGESEVEFVVDKFDNLKLISVN